MLLLPLDQAHRIDVAGHATAGAVRTCTTVSGTLRTPSSRGVRELLWAWADRRARRRRCVGTAARAARRCSSGQAVLKNGQWVAQGDPMEAALDAFAQAARSRQAGILRCTGSALGPSPARRLAASADVNPRRPVTRST
ncbi:MAG: hypothetical protein WCE29_28235, partial [Mycobacterium sp.]